jgi:hypothetical protein
LRKSDGPPVFVKILRALECCFRCGDFGLRALKLRLRVGVVVAEISEACEIENHAIGADLFLVRHRHERGGLDTVTFLLLGIDFDHSCAIRI